MTSVSVVAESLKNFIATYELCRADVLVVDGPDPVGDDAPLVLYVGMADPRSAATDNAAGNFTQEWPNATAQSRREAGSIVCAAVAYDGSLEDAAMKAARDAAFGIVADVQAMLWADPRLAVDGVVKTSFNSISFDQRATTEGALCAVLFSIDFEARLERAAA